MGNIPHSAHYAERAAAMTNFEQWKETVMADDLINISRSNIKRMERKKR
jgi:hypothetical protein